MILSEPSVLCLYFEETLLHIEMISEYFIENRDRMIESNGYFSITIVVYFIHDALERDGFLCLFIGVWWNFVRPNYIPRMRDILGSRGVI